MTYWRFIWFYLWIAPHVLLVAVMVLMFCKGLYKYFPIFFAYLVFEFLQFCLLFIMYMLFTMHSTAISASLYGNVDLFSRAGSIALHFGILQEMFESPVAHSAPLRRAAARMLNWVTAFLVLLAAVFIGSLYYHSLGHRLVPAYLTIEALNIAQCGGLVLVFLWHRFLGVRMSSVLFGIALGVGLTAALEPLIHAWRDSLTAQNPRTADFLQMASYHCSVLIWLYFVLARERVTSNSQAGSLVNVRESAADLGRAIEL